MRLPIRARMTALVRASLLAAIVAAVGAFLVVRAARRPDRRRSTRSLRPATAQIADGYRAEGAPEAVDVARSVLTGERPAAQILDPSGRVAVSFGDRCPRAPMLSARRRGRGAARRRELIRTRRARAQRPALPARRARDRAARAAGRSSSRPSRWRPSTARCAASSSCSLDRRAGRAAGHRAGRLVAGAPGAAPDRPHDGARRGDRPRAHRGPRSSCRAPATRSRTSRRRSTRCSIASSTASREQHRLVADASHELRTPLAAMRAEIDVSLRADDLPPAARQVLESAREEVDRMTRTVDDLLVLASVDEGRLELLRRAAATCTTSSRARSRRWQPLARTHDVDAQRSTARGDGGRGRRPARPRVAQPGRERDRVQPRGRRGRGHDMGGGRRGRA